MAKADPAPSTDIEKVDMPTLSPEQLRGIQSFDDAVAALSEIGMQVEDVADVIGDGFELLPTDAKSRLEGVPMVILSWRFSEGDMGSFVAVRILAKEGAGMAKYVITDGSTGIHDQLLDYTKAAKGKPQPLKLMHGLRRSDYSYTDADGKERPATTYYLDTSK